MNLKLGTRGSDLARTQAATVARLLEAAGSPTELVTIRTAGDLSSAPSFGAIGPQGVFVREIEQALMDRAIDLAVHSFKDLPTRSPDELVVAAVPARVDPADLLLLAAGAQDREPGALLPLRPGARVGTSSARRRVWLAHWRPDLAVLPLRGNVPTRIRRLADGDYDAILLAAAGIERLRADTAVLDAALAGLTIARLDPERFVPAPAQGALAIQCRRDRPDLCRMLGALDDPASRAAVGAERDALARAEGGCDVAFGAYCRPAADGFLITAMLERGGRVRAATERGRHAATLGAAVWRRLETAGADPGHGNVLDGGEGQAS